MHKPNLTEEELELLLGTQQIKFDDHDITLEKDATKILQQLTQTVTAMQHQIKQLYFKIETLEKQLAIQDVQARTHTYHTTGRSEDGMRNEQDEQAGTPVQEELSRVKKYRKKK